MAWTIEAKILPLAGVSGHLYIEIFDDQGSRVCQINGLAVDPATLLPRSVGMPGDKLKAYVSGDMVLGAVVGATRDHHPHQGCILFKGKKEDVMRAMKAAQASAAYLNLLDLPYNLLGLNSNSVFMHMVNAMSSVVPIDPQAVKNLCQMKIILPGVHKKISVHGSKKRQPPKH